MRTREETPPCWSCECSKQFDNEHFIRAYVVSDTLDDFKKALAELVFPADCQNCKYGLPPPRKRTVRELYIAVVDKTPYFWLPETYTTFRRDYSTTVAIPELATRTLGLLKTEINNMGFDGFVDVCVVTGDLFSTLEIVSTNPDTAQLVWKLVSPRSIPARRSQLEDVPELLQAGGFELIFFPVSVMAFPIRGKEQPQRFLLVHLGLSELPYEELALQIKSRLRFEFLQLVVRHFRDPTIKKMRKDLRARGVKVSSQILESVQVIINEAIVHSWRYSLPEKFSHIHAPSATINFGEIVEHVEYYRQQSERRGNLKAGRIAQDLLNTYIKSASIETLSAVLGTSRCCNLPQNAAALVEKLPEHKELFGDLLKYPPASLYAYDPEDLAEFFEHLVRPHIAIFSSMQKTEEHLQDSLGVLSRYINPYYWAIDET